MECPRLNGSHIGHSCADNIELAGSGQVVVHIDHPDQMLVKMQSLHRLEGETPGHHIYSIYVSTVLTSLYVPLLFFLLCDA
jgi:hypothetical protein